MSKIIDDAFKDIDPERSNIVNWLLDVIEKLNKENENLKKQLANTLPIQIVSCFSVCDGKCIINNTTNMCVRCGKEYNENNCN